MGPSVVGRISVRRRTARSDGPPHPDRAGPRDSADDPLISSPPEAGPGWAELVELAEATSDGDDLEVSPALRAVLSREVMAWLACGLSPLMSPAQQQCRQKVIAQSVQLVEYSEFSDGQSIARLAIEGVHTCKSSLCPWCVLKWQRTRATEIGEAITNHGPERTLFFTGTVRHNQAMSLGILVRVMRRAWGDLWSGRAGEELAARFGVRPEHVRAIDFTWSEANGWHPHIHALLFFDTLPGYTLAELESMLLARWIEALQTALDSYHGFVAKVLAGEPCKWKMQVYETKSRSTGEPVLRKRNTGIPACPCCAAGDECPNLRERACRLFGKAMVHPERTLRASLETIRELLGEFTIEKLTPDERYGVDVQRVRTEEGLDRYLSKLGAMGYELASATSKLGRRGKDGVMHYGIWEVAALACRLDDPLCERAASAWRQLYWATRGTQRIAFSDRRALGLNPDPYSAEELAITEEPPEPPTGETHRRIGEVDNDVWRERCKEEGQAFVARLYAEYHAGRLAELPEVVPDLSWHSVPATFEPPERAPPEKPWWQRLVEESAAQRKGRKAWRSTFEPVRGNPRHLEMMIEQQREKPELGRIPVHERLRTLRLEDEKLQGVSRLARWRRQSELRDRLRNANASKLGKAVA